MEYSTFIVGMSVLDDSINGITGTCIYSYNNHNFDENIIKNILEIAKDLFNGNIIDRDTRLIKSDVWSAPWLEKGYTVSFHSVTYKYDVSICEVYMSPEKYMTLENPLDEFYKYFRNLAFTHYRAESSNIILPRLEDIESLMMDINRIMHYSRIGKNDLPEKTPAWVQL